MPKPHELARDRIKDAWSDLEQVFLDDGTSEQWIACAMSPIDAALSVSEEGASNG